MKSAILWIIAILLVCSREAKSQEIIFDTEFGIQPDHIAKDMNGDFIITAMINDTVPFWQTMIVKVTPELDTTIRIIYDTLNDLFGPRLLITQNNNYIISTQERLDGSGIWADQLTFIVLNENLDIVAFKRYNYEHQGPAFTDVTMNFIQNEDGRIYGFGIRGENYDFITMEINEMGDTLRTCMINSFPGTTLYSDVIESHSDSVAYYAFIDGFDQTAIWKVLTVDTAFNYSNKGIILGSGIYNVQGPRACWLNDSIYMGVGFKPLSNGDKDLALYKANALQNHALVDSALWIVRPDTVDTPALNIPTFVNLDYIYVGSYRGSNPGASYNGRYMVAIVDEDLNIRGIKSLGHDGYQYELHCMHATDDLGCIVSGTVHDNANSPPYDWDMFIRKIMPGEIVQIAEKTEDPYDSDYFIYPNPGGEKLNVLTARTVVNLKIFNDAGEILYDQPLKGSNTSINLEHLPQGSYILQFTDEEKNTENQKWIKN